jgi:hypothetical protein
MTPTNAPVSFADRLPWHRQTPTFPVAPAEPTHAGLPIRAPASEDDHAAAMARSLLATSLAALASNLSTAMVPGVPEAVQARAPAILDEIEAVVAKLRDGDEAVLRQREAALLAKLKAARGEQSDGVPEGAFR